MWTLFVPINYLLFTMDTNPDQCPLAGDGNYTNGEAALHTKSALWLQERKQGTFSQVASFKKVKII